MGGVSCSRLHGDYSLRAPGASWCATLRQCACCFIIAVAVASSAANVSDAVASDAAAAVAAVAVRRASVAAHELVPT